MAGETSPLRSPSRLAAVALEDAGPGLAPTKCGACIYVVLTGVRRACTALRRASFRDLANPVTVDSSTVRLVLLRCAVVSAFSRSRPPATLLPFRSRANRILPRLNPPILTTFSISARPTINGGLNPRRPPSYRYGLHVPSSWPPTWLARRSRHNGLSSIPSPGYRSLVALGCSPAMRYYWQNVFATMACHSFRSIVGPMSIIIPERAHSWHSCRSPRGGNALLARRGHQSVGRTGTPWRPR